MSYQEQRTWEENRASQQQQSASTTSSSYQSTNVVPENQDYWYYCSHSYNADNNVNDKGSQQHTFYKNKTHVKKMDSLICNSYDMLREYFDPKMYTNQQLPMDLLNTCKGIIFLRIWKAGIFLGGIGGTGILMINNNGSWSYPCAISIGGIQFGLNLGVERVDDILLLRDDKALNLFVEKGHFKLGVDASIALGTFGRDSNTGVVMSGGESKSIYAYSFAKGAFIGLSLDGGVLTIDNTVNEEYYGRKLSVKEILYYNDNNNLIQDDAFFKLKNLLACNCSHMSNVANTMGTTNLSSNIGTTNLSSNMGTTNLSSNMDATNLSSNMGTNFSSSMGTNTNSNLSNQPINKNVNPNINNPII